MGFMHDVWQSSNYNRTTCGHAVKGSAPADPFTACLVKNRPHCLISGHVLSAVEYTADPM